jgi:hypothetical protein
MMIRMDMLTLFLPQAIFVPCVMALRPVDSMTTRRIAGQNCPRHDHNDGTRSVVVVH